jgi:glycosyltransferase involved in cell wall biosynthesis
LSDAPDDREYFAELQDAARGQPVRLVANASRDQVIAELQTSELFVHAMGYGVDEELEPEHIEHFGIATVEAMAAGCVPLVIGAGGQTEIVRHDVDGLHWTTLEELTAQLVRMGRDVEARNRMRSSAHARAKEYGLQQFEARVRLNLAEILQVRG